jgi:cysteine sulfinate desulfinase/cysteine desulfurase-like protein
MGRTPAEARSSLRISLGWNTTADEIAHAAALIPQIYERVAAAERGDGIEA